MLDIRLIREQPDFVNARIATRGGDDAAKVDEILRVDAERRRSETALQQLNADRKRISKEIGGRGATKSTAPDPEPAARECADRHRRERQRRGPHLGREAAIA